MKVIKHVSLYQSPCFRTILNDDCVSEEVRNSGEFSMDDLIKICTEYNEKRNEKMLIFAIVGFAIFIVIAVFYNKNKKNWVYIDEKSGVTKQ